MEAIFEYLMVLTSIIIGLGIANILMGFGEMLRSRHEVRESITHLAVVAVVLVLMLQHWWDSWNLHEVTYWTFPGLMLHLAGPVILFLASYLVFPRSVRDQDMLQYYLSQATLLWSLGALYLLTTLVYRPWIHGEPFDGLRAGVRLGGTIFCLSLALSKSPRVHAVGVWIAAALLAAFIGLFTLSAQG